MHIYYLQKNTPSLVSIYSLHATNSNSRKQYTVWKVQVCSLVRGSDCCPHSQVLRRLCSDSHSPGAAVQFIFVRTGAINNTHTGFAEHSEESCLCRRAVSVHFPAAVLTPSARVRLCLSQQRKETIKCPFCAQHGGKADSRACVFQHRAGMEQGAGRKTQTGLPRA